MYYFYDLYNSIRPSPANGSNWKLAPMRVQKQGLGRGRRAGSQMGLMVMV